VPWLKPYGSLFTLLLLLYIRIDEHDLLPIVLVLLDELQVSVGFLILIVNEYAPCARIFAVKPI
jgi:hypothetical protein